MIETQKIENNSKKHEKKRNYEEKQKERIGRNLNESDTLEETKKYEINKKENKKLLKKKIKREDNKVNENVSESEDNEKNELSTSLNPENIIDLNENYEEDPVEKNIIFVKSYSGKLKQEDLRKLFENYGKLKKINVSSKNFGFVEFCHKNTVLNVIKDKNKIYLNGKKLKIEYAKNKADKNITLNPSENISQKKEINIRRKEKKSEKFIEIETESKKESGENNNLFEIIQDLKDKIEKQNNKIEKQNNKIEKHEKEIKELKISIKLMDEINNQTEINSKKNLNCVNRKLGLIINAYKVLYMRKTSNLILEQLYKNYSDKLEKFKVQVGKNKYTIIFVKENIKNIKGINSLQINLIIDFLRFIWDKGSSIIHMNDKNINIQKEILVQFLNNSENKNRNQNIKNEDMIKIKDIINIIFDSKEEYNPNEKNEFEKDSNLVKIIKKIIEEKKSNEENSISESDELNEPEINEDQLKTIIEKEPINIDLSSQFKKLVKKIELNKENNIIIENLEDINGLYFYNLWKLSLNEAYKKKAFKNYIEIPKNISTLQKMGFYLCQLLEGITIDLFIDDPTNIDKNIKKRKNE